MQVWLLASVLSVGVAQLLGGWSTADPTNPEFQKVLQTVQDGGLAAVPNGFTLTAVRTQVVAGMNYKFTFEHTNNGAMCEIDVYSVPWESKTQVTSNTCKQYITKRAGGWQKQDASAQQYADLLQEFDTKKHLLSLQGVNDLQILEVQTQVVNGMNYKYKLLVHKQECTLQLYVQAWANNYKVTNDECHLGAHKRQLGGGWHVQDASAQQYADLLQEFDTKKHLLSLQGVNDLQILEVQTQVVSGMNYKYKLLVHKRECTLQLYVQAWTSTYEVTSDTCHLGAHKRQLAGGWHVQDASAQQYADLLQEFDTKKHLLSLQGVNDLQILEVQTQVVSGMNYKYKLLVHKRECTLQLYVQAWTSTYEVTSDTCHLGAHKRQLAGGWHVQDASAQQYADLLQEFDTKKHLLSLQGVNDLQILEVQTQVVSGMNYKYKLLVHKRECTLQLYVQAWTSTYEVTSDTCHLGAHKRQLAGGWHVQDASAQQYADLLQEFDTKKHLLSLQGVNDLQILEVQTQVVSGMNYKYKLLVHKHECTLQLYVQSWTNTYKVSSDTCNLMRHARQLGHPGGWHVQDPMKQEWMDLLSDLDTKYNMIDLSGDHNIEVLALATQVVNGINYNFTLKVHHKPCNFSVYAQQWSHTYRVTYDGCRLKAGAARRQAGMPGGWADQGAGDTWTQYVKDLVSKYNLLTMTTDSWKVLDVKTQVVAGKNIYIKLEVDGRDCAVQVFEQGWTKTREVTKDTCGLATRAARQLFGGMPSGYFKQNTSDPQWLSMLQDLDTQYHLISLAGDNGMQILGVQTQVVAGMNYRFTLKVHGKTCELVYFEQLWTNTREISQDTCGVKVAHKRFAVSSSTSDSEHKCLAAILDRINMMSNSMFRLVDQGHPKEQIQSVNGEVTGYFKIQLRESKCMNNQDQQGNTATECPPDPQGTIHSIWEAHCSYHPDGSAVQVTDLRMVTH